MDVHVPRRQQDTIEAGQGLGIARERSMAYSTDRTQSAMRGMIASVTALRSARAEGLDMMATRATAE